MPCLPDSWAENVCRVYPMENSRNNRLLWKTPAATAERPQEQRPPAQRLDTPHRQPRGALAYPLMSRSCAGGMRGDDGDSRSPPVTVP